MSTQIFSEKLVTASGGLDQFKDSLIVHVTSPEAFASAHIPGAVLLAPVDLVLGQPPATGKIAPPERLAIALQRIGYSPHRKIVVYDDEGGGWAGRFVWTLDVIGHHNWQYIDGGLHSWAACGGPIETGLSNPIDDDGPELLNLTYNADLIANCDELISAIEHNDPSLAIWDARSPAEHTGERSGSARAGRMPGSVNLDWLEVMDQENNLCLREDLPELLSARGLSADKTLIVHCQTHHRSGLAYLAAKLLGYPKVKGYDGSWAEWGNREDTPIISGPLSGDIETNTKSENNA